MFRHVRRKFLGQTSNIRTDEKQRRKSEKKVREIKGREGKEDQGRESQKKEDAVTRKGREVARLCVFSNVCRLAKAVRAEPAGQMKDRKLHALVARSTFPSQNVQNTPASDHFGS